MQYSESYKAAKRPNNVQLSIVVRTCMPLVPLGSFSPQYCASIAQAAQTYVHHRTACEVHRTTHDEYGLKAGGILAALDKFEMLFGLKLGHLLFSAAEDTSKVLQAKDTSVQESKAAVHVTRPSISARGKRKPSTNSIEALLHWLKPCRSGILYSQSIGNLHGELMMAVSHIGSASQRTSSVNNTLQPVTFSFKS